MKNIFRILLLFIASSALAYDPSNPNGQATMANSAPVVIASDQSAINVNVSAGLSGYATSSLQTTGNTYLGLLVGDLQYYLADQGSNYVGWKGSMPLAIASTSFPGYTNNGLYGLSMNLSGGLRVDGSGVIQPMSASSLPLPALAATSTKQSDGSQKTQLVDGSGNVISSTGNALNVNATIGSIALPTGASTAALQTTGNSSLSSIDGKITAVNTGAVVVSSSALPTSASTSALQTSGNSSLSTIATNTTNASTTTLQTTGNNSLSSIDSKTPALGQALAASSIPVVLTAAQITTLTPLSTVTANIGTTNGLALDATLTGGSQTTRLTDGTNTATVKAASIAAIATDKALVVAISPNNSLTVSNSANGNTGSAVPTQATQVAGSDGTNLRALKVSSTGVLSVDGSAVTQPVSGTVSVSGTTTISGTVTANAGTNLNTSALALDATLTGGSQQTKITDGTTLAKVIPASTSAVATDPSLNIAISPNSNIITLKADSAGSGQNVTTQDVASLTSTVANGQSLITGVATAGSSATFSLTGVDSAQVQVTGVWTGTVQVEASYDAASTFFPVNIVQTSSNGATTGFSFTNDFSGLANVAGATNIRVRATAAITGTATARIVKSMQSAGVFVANTIPVNIVASSNTQIVSGTVTANQGGAPWADNITQFGGVNLSTGTGASGTGIPRVTVANDSTVGLIAGSALVGKVGIDQTTPGTTNLVSAAQNSTWTVQPGNTANSTAWLVTGTGGTFPATESGTWSNRITDGTNTAAVKASTTAAGATDPALVVAISPNNIVAISATSLPLPTNAATSANVTGLQVAQGSTTSAQNGTLTQGAVTTAAPSYTTAQTSPLSLTTAGSLRGDISSVAGSTVSTAATGVIKTGVTGNTGAAMDAAGQNVASPANELLIGGQFNTSPTTISTGNISPLQLTSAGSLIVQDKADGTVSAGTAAGNSTLGGLVYNTSAPAPTNTQQVSLQGDPAANLRTTSAPLQNTFTFTANAQNLDITLQGHNSVGLTIASGTSTLIGTLTPSCIFGGSTNTAATNFINVTTGVTTATQVAASATAYNLGVQICPGATGIRVATTAFTSGSGVAYLNATYGQNQQQAFTSITDGTTKVAVISGTTALKTDLSSVAGTATVTAGVSGMAAVGGNIAPAAAPTANPVPTGGMDIAGLTRRVITTDAGGATAGEMVSVFNEFTAGSATAAEGTNSKTFQSFAGRNAEVYLGLVAQGNAADTMQLEGSYDNQIFSVIPLSRIDNLAAYSAGVSGQYTMLGAWTPVTGAIYKGRTYGYNFIRVHQTAFTTTGSNGIIRIVKADDDADNSVLSAFTFDAQNTTEAAGTANGVLQSGGVRTLNTRGQTRGQLYLDAFTYATAAPTASTFVVEGSVDNATWISLDLQPRGGGATVASITTTPPAIGQWLGGQYEFDCSKYLFVRARWSAFTIGTATVSKYHGALKLIGAGQTLQQRKATYRTASVVAPAVTATDIYQLIGSATKTVEVTRIWLSGTQTTGGMVDVYISKRSTANSAGTSTAPTIVPMLATSTAATAVAALYTANPTTGTPVGNVWLESLPLSAATGTTNNMQLIDFTAQPLTLFGVAQAMAINLNSVTVTGGSIKITVEFSEY